ncbi:UNVERIFIED_CONTAM: hypothetical protein NCL1_21078 [Trichonephila clavipes]
MTAFSLKILVIFLHRRSNQFANVKGFKKEDLLLVAEEIGEERLSNLMQFIKAEVEGEERINLAMSGFGLNESKCTQSYKKKQCQKNPTFYNSIPTAANLLTAASTVAHAILICDKLDTKKTFEKNEEKSQVENNISMSNLNKRNNRAVLVSGDKKKSVRLLLDSASHRSYILKNVAREMEYPSLQQEKLVYLLFGSISSKQITHDCYKIWLRDLDENFACNFDALDQDKI